MSNDSRKQVLVLGAGMVCAPLVEYLYRDERISINVCSQFKEEADGIANRLPGKVHFSSQNILCSQIFNQFPTFEITFAFLAAISLILMIYLFFDPSRNKKHIFKCYRESKQLGRTV